MKTVFENLNVFIASAPAGASEDAWKIELPL